MRTLHSSFEFPPQSSGGLGTYLNDLLKYQLACGDDVVLAFHGEGDIDEVSETVRAPSFGPGGQLLTYPAEHYGAVDVLVTHDWQGLAATASLWRSGVPLVYTCHLPLQWDVGEFSDVPCEYDHELEFAGLLRADRVVCVSTAVEHQLHTQYPFTRDKTVVRPNGTDVDFFIPDATRTDEPRILFLGRYCEQKGFDLLPEIMGQIWAEAPEACLEIMGTGPMEAAVRERFDKHLRVDWRPFGNLDAVRAAYRRSTVVLMPSRLEPFGLVAIEAMASGTPLIAAATGGLSDIVDDGETGVLVSAADPAAYAAATLSLLAQPRLRQSMAHAAREHVVATYDIRRRMQAVRSMYQDVYDSTIQTRNICGRP